MRRAVWWIVGLVVAPLVLLGVIALVLQRWVHSDDFRNFVADQITNAVGVPVQLGSVDVDVWPLPAVALNQVQVRSTPPLTLERIVARPSWAPLLRGRLEVQTLIVRNAVVPEPAVAAIAAAFQKKPAAPKKDAAPAGGGVHVAIPRKVVLDGISWVSAKGTSNTIDLQASFDDDGLPGEMQVSVRKGNYQGAKAQVTRDAQQWLLRAQVGGGTVSGPVRLKLDARGVSLLQGQLDTANVEVAALTAPARTLTGRIDAHTTVRAEFRDIGALADSLTTQTKFTVRGAVVHGIDLAQAVKSVGMNRGGETRLDALAGNVATQGRSVQLTNLVATSGSLSASGNIAMTPAKALSGRITVDLTSNAIGGALGVPLVVGGTLDSPSVMLSRGALLGAAIGTAIAPGLGTGGGAKIGDRLGEGLKGLFGR